MSETLVLTHGCSLSNLPLFVAVGEGLFADQGLRVEAPYFDDITSTAELLVTGVADLGTAGFTQPLIDSERTDPPVLVAGSGLMGVFVLTRELLPNASALAGAPVGTFRTDPMEVLLHDVLAASGLSMSDVEIRYFDVLNHAIEEFEAGELAALTLAEPYAGRVRAAGAHVLSDGTDVWGNPFPDTTLVASSRFLRERPDQVRAAIRAMLRAYDVILADLPAALRHARDYFPGYSLDELVDAVRRQPSRIDIRDLTATVYGRWDTLRSLDLVSQDAEMPLHAVNLDLLNAELAAVPAAKEIAR
ncbi:ABC transporter substrate-binding protein [Mycolicibacterium rhodesiae]|nr:ABC transporter substrate-binding protein [Mycolicibacterium rhodesiae]MCV7344761.1 ABC transporter substrate-binding protein [Mycolicibacterium rhodesiae]